MSFGVPDDFKELLRDRTDLVALVSETVQLQATRGGQDHVGLCPFHDDRNPSLHVYPDRHGGTYRCWVCQEGGDCFSWVQEIERLSFPEAIEFLANRLGVAVPKSGGRPQQSNSQRQALYDVLAWAEAEMHNYLRNAADAAHVREYLDSRGYGADIISQFRLGYHPDSWTWLQDRSRGRYSAEQLFRVRLLGENDRGGYYDNLVDRVVFPIRDDRNRPVAFGGRILPGSENPAKYWNSPESDFFHKSKLLYAFEQARQAIRQSGTAVVVEGYTDCISCHQFGLHNVVATLGTALTEQHVSKIRRFGRRVVLVYDGDVPGQQAAERAVSRILAQEVDLRVLTLPAGEDPADLLSRAGVDEFHRLAAAAPEAIDYKFDRCIERHGTESIDARERVRDEMLELLASCPNLAGTDRLDIILGRLARTLVTDEWRIRNRLSELTSQRRRPAFHVDEGQQPVATPSVDQSAKAETEVLEIIFIQPDQLELIRSQIGVEDFDNPRLRALFERILDLSEAGTFDGPAALLNSLDENRDLKNLTVALVDSGYDKGIERLLNADMAPGQTSYLDSVLNAIKLRRTERQTELSKHQLSQATSDPSRDTLDALRRFQHAQSERMGHPSTLK